jgi:hypothetical protein
MRRVRMRRGRMRRVRMRRVRMRCVRLLRRAMETTLLNVANNCAALHAKAVSGIAHLSHAAIRALELRLNELDALLHVTRRLAARERRRGGRKHMPTNLRHVLAHEGRAD